jgi:hypothetical protein
MPLILGANSASGGYNIKNSVRFNNASSDELARTNGTATDGKKCTISFWIKKCRIEGSTTTMRFMQAYSGVGNQFHSQWGDGSTSPGDQWNISPGEQGGAEGIRMTNAAYRDPSAWYHYLWYWDSVAQLSTLYVNGESQSSSLNTAVVLNQITSATKSGTSFRIKSSISGTAEFYLAEFYIIDGQALTPSSFGETDTLTGIWKPKAYTGTFGNNGVYLDFEDSSNLGNDMSGNNNDFTVTNLTSVDQSTDTPTNNFCTLNFIQNGNGSTSTLTEGNLVAGTADNKGVAATFGVNRGKWFFEVKNSGTQLNQYFGVSNRANEQDGDASPGLATANIRSFVASGAFKNYSAGSATSNASFLGTNGTIFGFALDLDNGTLGRYVNGSLINTDTTLPSDNSVTFFPFTIVTFNFGNWNQAQFNFGSPMYAANSYADAAGFGNFSYAVPSGYYSLCTKNLANFG